MNGKLFVDTNILVYARDAGEPEKQPIAEQALAELWETGNGRTSMQVCNEYYITVTQKLRPGMDAKAAWQDIEALFAWKPLPMDEKVLKKARDCQLQYTVSWWDSLIIAAAYYSECSKILTEDLNHGQKHFGILIGNPFL